MSVEPTSGMYRTPAKGALDGDVLSLVYMLHQVEQLLALLMPTDCSLPNEMCNVNRPTTTVIRMYVDTKRPNHQVRMTLVLIPTGRKCATCFVQQRNTSSQTLPRMLSSAR